MWRWLPERNTVKPSGRIFDVDSPAVAAGALLALAENVETIGCSADILFEGLAVDRARLSRPLARVSWGTLVRAIENLERQGVGQAKFQELGRAMSPSPHLRLIRMATVFVRPEHLLYAGVRWVGPALFPVLDNHVSFRGRELSLRLAIPEHLPPSLSYFHICLGMLSAIPEIIGQPTAEVQATLTERNATFQIRCVRQARGIARVARVARSLLSAPDVIQALDEQDDDLRLTMEAGLRWQKQFRDMLEALPDGVLVTQSVEDTSLVLYANPAFARIVGRDDPASLVGLAPTVLMHPTDEDLGEARLAHANGHGVPCELSAAQHIVFDDVQARLVVVRNITERKQLQGQLAVADKTAALGMLAAGIAHEINNPLALLLANLQLHAARHGSSPQLQTAIEGAQRVGAIVGDLRLFSQPDNPTPHPVQLADVIKSTVNLAAGRISPRATVKIELDGAPQVNAQQGRVGQVLLNLLINAADAFHEQTSAQDNLICIRLWRAGDMAVVEVSDNGPGIEPDRLARLFEPFFTTKPSGAGSGLGLAVASGIVAGYGGSIRAESEPGVGSRFIFELPIASTSTSQAAAETQSKEPPPGKVLLIDDEAMLLSALGDSLTLLGHQVATATSGNTAIELLAKDANFDAIVCDLTMADGGGSEVHHYLQAHRPELVERLIFTTGGTFRAETRDFLVAVPNPCLEKPFALAELQEAVARVMAS